VVTEGKEFSSGGASASSSVCWIVLRRELMGLIRLAHLEKGCV
jgi:hypothetical protein